MTRRKTRSREGWARVRFGDVVRLVRDRVDPAKSGLTRYVAGEHMDTDELRIRRWGNVGDGYLGPAFHMRFKPGHVLYGSRRTYLRKVALADFEGICANTTYVLESADPSTLLPELLPFIMQTEAFHEHSVKQAKGSVNPYVNFSDLAWHEFDLPPMEEQNSIARIYSALENTKTHTDCLTNAATHNAASYLDSEMARDEPFYCTVKEAVDRGALAPPQDGNHGEKHPKATDYRSSGIPFLMAADITDGSIDLNRCKFIDKRQADSLRIGFAKTGDVLLTHKGTLGQWAIVPELLTDYVMLTPQVSYYRTNPSILLPEYLAAVFCSPWFQRQLGAVSTGSTRLYIGITDQRRLTIPCPSIDRQKVVIRNAAVIRTSIRLARHRQTELASMASQLLAAYWGRA
jgi:type I restriction enzyme S subunit